MMPERKVQHFRAEAVVQHENAGGAVDEIVQLVRREAAGIRITGEIAPCVVNRIPFIELVGANAVQAGVEVAEVLHLGVGHVGDDAITLGVGPGGFVEGYAPGGPIEGARPGGGWGVRVLPDVDEHSEIGLEVGNAAKKSASLQGEKEEILLAFTCRASRASAT